MLDRLARAAGTALSIAAPGIASVELGGSAA
jgi:hypothetical protein